jgi:hypothetical protein
MNANEFFPVVPARAARRTALAIGTTLVLILSAPGMLTAKHFSAWGPATLEVGINSAQADGCPIESPNGLSLFIASTRPGAVGGATDANDIWVAQRASKDAAWSSPVHLPEPVNSVAADFCPTPLNGNWLLFVSARSVPGACGAGDMYIARRNPAHGWAIPTNLGCDATGQGPNFAGGEFSPSLIETDEGVLLYFSSTGLDGLDQDIYVSRRRSDGTFAPATPVEELNTAANDQMPNVSRDGLEIVFSSDRTGTFGGQDVYTAHRASTTDPWSSPVNVGPNVNTSAAETRASLSGDGERLHFGRLGDIWVSTRSNLTGGS